MIKTQNVHKNKKGAVGTNLILTVLLLVVVIVGGLLAVGLTQQTAQTALGSAGDACTENKDCRTDLTCSAGQCVQPAAENPKGKAATLRVVVFDKAALANTQVATGIHLWGKPTQASPDSEYKRLTTSNQQSSATAVTTVSTVTGKYVKGVPFNRSTYYGKIKEFSVDDEVQVVELDAYQGVANNITVTVFDQNGEALAANAANASVPTNGDYTFDKIRLRQNASERTFVFGGLAFNTVENTNLTISSTNLPAYGKKVVRLASSGDFVLKIAEPLWMNQNDEFDVENVKFETSGTACGSTQEAINVRILDWAYYEDRNAMLAEGFEDDASTPADVGQGDLQFQMSCGA